MTARDRLIVGLDVPNLQEAEKVIAALGDDILYYKIGYQLVFAGGLNWPAISPPTARRYSST